MRACGYGLIWAGMLFLSACGPGYSYSEFTSFDGEKDSAQFDADVEYCDSEREKYLNLIRGRQAGYSGSETGFLGCMHTRGWKKNTS